MQEKTVVAVDAMGGDNAPGEIVRGALDAIGRRGDIKVILVGKSEAIQKELAGASYPKDQLEIVEASEVIETAEPPVMAIRKKKDSSIVVAMNLVKQKKADAFCVGG